MNGEETTRAPDGSEAFVNEEPIDVCLFLAAIAMHALNPRRVIDELLEGCSAFDNIL